MDFGGEFTCPSCKENLEVTIWDGVTVSFSRTSVLPTIAPPTVTNDASPVRHLTLPQRRQQLIDDSKLRGDLESFLDGPPIILDMDLLAMVQGDANGGARFDYEAASAELRRKVDRQVTLMERYVEIPALKLRLDGVDPALGGFFQSLYGEREGRQSGTTPEVYRELFRQIAAEESVLQMINGSDMERLRTFLQRPDARTASDLMGIPALYRVVRLEEATGGVMERTKTLCRWLYVSARTVLTLLEQQQNDGTNAGDTVEIVEDDWRKVCRFEVLEASDPHLILSIRVVASTLNDKSVGDLSIPKSQTTEVRTRRLKAPKTVESISHRTARRNSRVVSWWSGALTVSHTDTIAFQEPKGGTKYSPHFSQDGSGHPKLSSTTSHVS